MTKKRFGHNIIFVTISMTGGGTERVIATLANYWCEVGFSVSILMIGGNDVAYKIDERVDVKCISEATEGDLVARLDRIKSLRNEFLKDSSAVIIAMGTVAAMFSSAASFGLKNRLILSERNDPNRLNHRPIKSLERMLRNILYIKADAIVFQTRMALDCFPKSIHKIGHIILNPVREDLTVIKRYPERRKTIITAGRLTEQKNHKLLIDAFSRVYKSYPDYKLEIYGNGEYKEELENYIAEKNIDEAVELKGFSENLMNVMNDARIYVSSSDWEGISNSLAEAMSSGMAVVATDCPMGGSAMLINDNENGILTKVGDCDELANAIDRLIGDEAFAAKISVNAAKLKDDLKAASIARKWEALFE